MTGIAIRFAVVLLVLIIGDAAWLSYFAKAMFRPALGDILLDTPRWGAAIAFYLIYAAGVMVFPLAMGLFKESIGTAILYGALFGFLAYMTYDLTNLATIKAWTVPLALIDMSWGAVLTAAATAAGFAVAQRF
ncbi:MAG TPA: DUF2177 family protein [Rhizomicrobium sp.]|jgi:uncharacterized membrane protein